MKRKFTLVELLMVIAIIGILAALLLPALNRALFNSDTVRCLSNHRQIGSMMHAYSSKYDGYIPPTSEYYFGLKSWIDVVSIMVDPKSYLQIGIHSEEDEHRDSVLTRAFKEEGWAKVFKCPAAEAHFKWRKEQGHTGQHVYNKDFCSSGVNGYLRWGYASLSNHKDARTGQTYSSGGKTLRDANKIMKVNNFYPGVLYVTEAWVDGPDSLDPNGYYPQIYGVLPRHGDNNEINVLYIGGNAATEDETLYLDVPNSSGEIIKARDRAPWSPNAFNEAWGDFML